MCSSGTPSIIKGTGVSIHLPTVCSSQHVVFDESDFTFTTSTTSATTTELDTLFESDLVISPIGPPLSLPLATSRQCTTLSSSSAIIVTCTRWSPGGQARPSARWTGWFSQQPPRHHSRIYHPLLVARSSNPPSIVLRNSTRPC